MVSLLARLPHGRGAGGRVPLGWLAVAAILAVNVAGLAGLGAAIAVVQTLDPFGGLPVSGSAALAGRLWLLAHGGELALESGPIVLAPLLLTLAIAWGLARAGRGVVRAHGVTGPRAAGRTVGVLVAAHLLVCLLLGAVVDATAGGVGLWRTAAGVAVLALASVGWGVARESGVLDAALDRLPGAPRPLLRGVLAGLLAAMALCFLVVALALASDARGYATLSGSLGGAGAGAAGLLGLAVLLLPNAAAAVLGLAAGPGFYVGADTLVSVHGVTLGAVPALPLLAALPDTQAVPLIAFASQAVPALAGLVAGATVGRWFTDADGGSLVAGLTGILAGVLLGVGSGALAALPDTQAVPLIAFVSQAVPALAGLVAGATVGRWFTDADGGSLVAGLTGILAGVLLGVGSGALAWVAGGSLGDGGLAQVGAPALATGVAMAAQCGIAAALAAAVTRWCARG